MKKILSKIKKYKNDNLILIYQQGKVGSRSLSNSIKKKNISQITIHSFHSKIATQLFNNYNSKKYYISKLNNIHYKTKMFFLLKLLKNNKKLKIISLVREPISRNISFYFQDFQIPLMEISSNRDTTISKNINIEVFIDDFFKNFNHTNGINWFDNELKKYFDLNIYKYPFDKERGYSIIKKDNIEFLIIKLEKLNRLKKGNLFNDFLNVKNFNLTRKNDSKEKWYDCIYKDFKESIVFSEKYINRIYNSKYMRHFYTNEEILKFKNYYNED